MKLAEVSFNVEQHCVSVKWSGIVETRLGSQSVNHRELYHLDESWKVINCDRQDVIDYIGSINLKEKVDEIQSGA